MIQRIQSLLLLLAIVCSVLLIFFPTLLLFPAAGLVGDVYGISALKTDVYSGGNHKLLMLNWPLIILNSLIILLYIVIIFGYKKRLQQVKICNITLLFQALLILLFLYESRQVAALAGENYTSSPGWGVAFLPISILLIFSARYYILKDEALVRSADRLR